MAANIDIVVMGYIFNENIQWPDGRTEGPFLGGTASYGAVALGRLGANAGLVTNVGRETPAELLQPLFECGIDIKGVNFKDNASETKNLLIYHDNGTKEIKYLSRAPGIMFEDIPEDYLKAGIYHLCLVDYEVPVATIDAIKAVNPDALFSADFGGTGGAHSTPEQRARYIFDNNGHLQSEYLSRIDIGKASIEDAEIAFSKKFSSEKEVAQLYISYGVKIVVVTLGSEGAYICTDKGKEYRIRPVTPYNGVIDTTGAGDTYISTFICEYMGSDDIEYSAYFAGATSSLLIEKTGGVRIDRTPDRQMVERRLQRFLSIK